MERYFFIVTYPGLTIDDSEGKLLPNDAVAIEHARLIVNDLMKDRRPEDPEPTIIVKTVSGDVIFRLPNE
jgi:hypothetical protein